MEFVNGIKKQLIRLCIHVTFNLLIPNSDKTVKSDEPDELNPPLLLCYQMNGGKKK